MKTIWTKIKAALHKGAAALKQVKGIQGIVSILLAEIIFWMPVWLPGLLGLLVNKWWYSAAAAVVAFWAGPFTPAVPLQIGFILLIYKIIGGKRPHKENKNDRRKRNSRKSG